MTDPNTPANDDEEGPASRAKRLLAALNGLYPDTPPEDALVELLTDARHLADAHSLNYGATDRTAYGFYRNERNEAAGLSALINGSGQGRSI